MQVRTPAVLWPIRAVAVLFVAGLGLRLVTLDLETADKVASVVGCLAGVAALLWTALATSPGSATVPAGRIAGSSNRQHTAQMAPIRVRLRNRVRRSDGTTQNFIIGTNGPVNVGDRPGNV